MGYEKESDAPEHYHCEECRPDLHQDLECVILCWPPFASIRVDIDHCHRYPKHRARPPSIRPQRASRSRSPTSAVASHGNEKNPKRRNTMNSRETAYHDVLMKQVQDGETSFIDGDSLTAPERTSVAPSSANPDEEQEHREQEINGHPKKKRRSMTTPAAEG